MVKQKIFKEIKELHCLISVNDYPNNCQLSLVNYQL